MGRQIVRAFVWLNVAAVGVLVLGWGLSNTAAFQKAVPLVVVFLALKCLPLANHLGGAAPAMVLTRDPVSGERVLTGIHEAGHAHAFKASAGGWAKARVASDGSGYTKTADATYLQHAVAALAGGIAERKAGGPGGDWYDRSRAKKWWRMSGVDVSFGEVERMAEKAVGQQWGRIVRDGTRLAEGGGWLKV
jgi:hypothetical protein